MKERLTQKKIAALAGVSVGAVSTAFSARTDTTIQLSDETRRRILAIAREYHYVPNIAARAMQSRKSFLLGFFYHADNHYVQTEVLRGIRQVCLQHDYDIIIYPCTSPQEAQKAMQTAHVEQLDGLILFPFLTKDGNLPFLNTLSQADVPIIQLFTSLAPKYPCITRDYQRIGYEAYKVLYDHGHRSIGVLIFDNYTDAIHGPASYSLMQGIRNAEQQFGSAVTLFPIRTFCDFASMGKAIDDAVQPIVDSRPPLTALIAVSSSVVYRAFYTFNRAGISIPKDLSIVSCGNDIDPHLRFPEHLSFFPVPLEQMGARCAQYCLGLSQISPTETQLFYEPIVEGNTISTIPI